MLLEPLTPHQKRILLPTNYSRQIETITKGCYFLKNFSLLNQGSIHATVAQFHLVLTRRSIAIPFRGTVPKTKWNIDVLEPRE